MESPGELDSEISMRRAIVLLVLLLPGVSLATPRVGCPVPGTRVQAKGLTLPPQETLNTPPVAGQAGEIVHVRAMTNDSQTHLTLRKTGPGCLNGCNITSSGPGTQTAISNVSAQDGFTYSAMLHNNSNNTIIVWLTLELAGTRPSDGAPCGFPDTCFGLNGQNCTNCLGGLTTSGLTCTVTLGSQSHDSCCSVHPGGKMCGGAEDDLSCPAALALDERSTLCCTAEWNRAVTDTAFFHGWDVVVDPSAMTYRPASLLEPVLGAPSTDPLGPGPWIRGQAIPGLAILAPSGTHLDLKDDPRQWCQSGNFFPSPPLDPDSWWCLGFGSGDQAMVMNQSIPARVVAGQWFTATVDLKNTGTATWQPALGYRLGAQNPQDNMTWGMSRVELPSNVPPGGALRLPVRARAPTVPGTYHMQFRMVHELVNWFGDFTPDVAVVVSPTTTLTDELNDYSLVYSHTSSLGFDTTNVSLFQNDPKRLARGASGPEEIVWNVGGASSATATVYYWPDELVSELMVLTSNNGTTWTQVQPTVTTFGVPSGNWLPFAYTINVPATFNYLKLRWTNNATIHPWSPQIGRVTIE